MSLVIDLSGKFAAKQSASHINHTLRAGKNADAEIEALSVRAGDLRCKIKETFGVDIKTVPTTHKGEITVYNSCLPDEIVIHHSARDMETRITSGECKSEAQAIARIYYRLSAQLAESQSIRKLLPSGDHLTFTYDAQRDGFTMTAPAAKPAAKAPTFTVAG